MKMPFGPYKGMDTKLLPESYILDLYKNTAMAGALLRSVKEEMIRRNLKLYNPQVVRRNTDYQPPPDISSYDLALCSVRDFRSGVISGRE